MYSYNKKKSRIKNIQFFILQFLFLAYIENVIWQKVTLGLKHFRDIFSSPKNLFFLQLLNYKTIFEKALNSNFTYGIHVIFKHGRS